MLQRYHLVARNPYSFRVLVDLQPVGWLLPVVSADARARAPHVISAFLRRMKLHGLVGCVTAGVVDDAATGIDWLAVVNRISDGGPSPSLAEAEVDDLLDKPALLPVQSTLLRAYGRLSEKEQSTLRCSWLPDAVRWVMQVSPGRIGTPLRAIPHRTELFHAMWEFRDAAGSVYLKWRGNGELTEARLAQTLAVHGAAVPNTLAYEASTGRWLTEGVRARRLTNDLSPRTVQRVASALARVQMNLFSSGIPSSAVGVRSETLADLVQESDRILAWLPDPLYRHEVERARSQIHRSLDAMDDLALPSTWIHTDFVPENIFIDDRDQSVVFIDFDDAWIGPAPVAMEFLFSGIRRCLKDPDRQARLLSSARAAYTEAWRSICSPEVMQRAFASTRLVAQVLRVSRRLRDIHEREKNGELSGLLNAAARESAGRLARLASIEGP